MTATHPSAAALCCMILGIALLQLAGAQDSPPTAPPAAEFCASPAGKQATCGWASNDEQSAAYKGCLWCGTVWRGTVKPSRSAIAGHDSYWQYAGNMVSLGCRPGKLVVRAVFKPTAQNGNACVRLSAAREGTLTSSISNVTRCELQLPPGGDEFEAALRSKEVNCKPCRSCNDCNTALNKWYSDTFTANWEGCAGVTKAGDKPYEPFTPAMIINPRSSVVMAKFEVQQ